MKTFAAFTDIVRVALINRDYVTLAEYMNKNFGLRRELYGDQVVGYHNLRMTEIAREHGHAATQSGSGGCILGIWANADVSNKVAMTLAMKKMFRKEGYIYSVVQFDKTC
jgi:glucuronokinase